MSRPPPHHIAGPTGPIRFPPEFSWGAATSSYQIEGDRAGRGANVWDAFCRQPGAVLNGDHGDVACDHLRLVDDDVALMVDLGLQSYRFSFSWPRVLPSGVGHVAQSGLDQYRRLVDLLLQHGIEPVPTLFHWDLPQALEDRGGFRSRECAWWFADYAAMLAAEFGDRVTRWATFNEPWCYAFLGHAAGLHAPGLNDPAAAVAVAHHELLGHGLALVAMRAARSNLSLGVVLNVSPVHRDDSLTDDDVRRIDGTLNRWFLDPVLAGRYPVDVIEDLGVLADCVRPGDEALIGVPLDWLGVNYYHDHTYALATGEQRLASPHVTAAHAVPLVHDGPATDIGWPITPAGFGDLLRRLHRDYALPPIYITENGVAYTDPVVAGRCDDPRRVDYLEAHLRSLHTAMADGVDVRGYFAWSLFDNFEWAFGFDQRFGLVHVDYSTLVRTPKTSARWFADVCRSGSVG